MKKSLKQVVMWSCLICVLLTGCGGSENKTGSNKESGTNGSGSAASADVGDPSAAEGELSLYCMAGDDKIDQYIVGFRDVYKNVKVNKTAFEDAGQMDDLIKSELNAGKGPDMIIFPSQTDLDVLNMAKNGAFAALDDKMKEDGTLNTEDYLPGTFEAGKVDGKVYVLPLTFNIPVYIYDSTEELKFTAAPVIPYGQFIDAAGAEMEELKQSEGYAAFFSQNWFAQLLKTINPVTVSNADQTVTIEEAVLEKMMKLGYSFYHDGDRLNNILTLYSKSELELIKHFKYINFPLVDVTHYIWFYNNLYREAGIAQPQVSVLSSDDGSVAATAETCGMITKNAAPYAYEFMRIAMDTNPYSNKMAVYGMSPNKNNIKDQIEAHKSMTSIYQSISMQGLDDRMADILTQIYDSITDIKIFNPVISGMCMDSFDPYLDNIKSYEECYRDFEQKLKIYAGE